MSRTGLAVTSGNNHLSTSVKHITANIVYIWSLYTARTTYYYIICRVDTIAAGTVCAQQIIPAIAIQKVCSLTVDSDILLLVTLYTESCLWIELYKTDGAEISTIACPQTTCSGI